jgi:heme exporter protein D
MVEKVAVPFWLCCSAGVIVGLITGRLALWLAIGAAVGVLLGLVMRAAAKHRQKLSFHGASKRRSSKADEATTPVPEVRRAA